jgi:hypothetical protein
MDQVYMTKMAEAFLDELSEIEKEALSVAQAGQGLLNAARTGVGSLGKILGRVGNAPMALNTSGRITHALGGRQALQAGGLRKFLGAAGQKGREAALAQGKSGTMGYLRGLAGTTPVQAGLTVAAPLAAGYALG